MHKTLTRFSIAALAAAMLFLCPTSSFATPVTGTLNITGDTTIAATTLTFLCDITGVTCPANYGAMAVTGSAAQTGTFSSLANTFGNIESISQATTPINQPFLLSNFITFKSNPDIVLDLTFLFAGTGGPCPPSGSASCTPMIPALVSPSNPLGLSPFTLSNTQTGSTADFSVAGQTRRVSTGEVSPFNGVFTMQFTNTPGTTDASVAALLAQLALNGSITTAYSATFKASAVPEPGTTSLILGGLLVLAGTGFKRFKAKA
jgi:hypothetical protein